jgi:alpha-ketoglutarate-dependent taurine dioxygenase
MSEDGVRVVTGRGEPLSSIPRADKLALLREHGAVLFRGFAADTEELLRVAGELGQRFYNMALDPRIRELVTPDGVVAGVLKGKGALPLHMERGYSPLKPELILFHVLQPSPVGGESLLCSGARVLGALAPATVERFRRKRLLYRHLWEPEAWQGRYGKDPGEVARLFETLPDVVEHGFDGDLLRYTYVVPAIVRSRLGGGEGFVNNLEGAWKLQNAPRETRLAVHEHAILFEDGEPMTQELVDEVHAAVAHATEVHPVQACDVVVLDNYRFMHGRRAFEGDRVMHTVMADARL